MHVILHIALFVLSGYLTLQLHSWPMHYAAGRRVTQYQHMLRAIREACCGKGKMAMQLCPGST